MAQEIERKFLPANENWRSLAEGVFFSQGYLCADEHRSVRVRVAGDLAWLTVKGSGEPDAQGFTRSEYEYAIPVADALEMLAKLCRTPLIEKKRYRIPWQGFTWEVDEFFGLNAGLVVAEIELEREDQPFRKPSWIGREVTGDPRYFNAALCRLPYSLWPQEKPSGAG